MEDKKNNNDDFVMVEKKDCTPGQEENTPKENEYHLKEKRLFVPGITRKEDKARVLVPLRKK